MKTRLFVPLATALAGFALGWAFKPAPEPPPAAEANAGSPPANTRASTADRSAATLTRDARPELPGANIPPDDLRKAELEHRATMQKAFKDAALQRDRGKLLRVAEALRLDEAQLAQLEAMLVEQRHAKAPVGAEDFLKQDPKASLDAIIQSAKENDAKFRALLTPEQDAALTAMRGRQSENQVETRAQRNLAEVTERLDLTPQQREAALDVLRAEANKTQERYPDGSQLVSDSSLVPLVPAGQYSQGSVEAMALLAAEPPESNDQIARQRKLQEIQQRQSLERAESLSGILTPAQLDQLRVATEANNLFRSSR